MASISSQVEVLIFGDSHAFYGLNPKYFSKQTFNMANVSQTIYFDKLLFENYLSQTKNLKYVILPIEYTTLSQKDNTQEDIWRKYFYEAYMHIDVPLIKPYDPKKYSLALTQKFRKSLNYFNTYLENKTLIGCDANGWGNTYKTAIDSLELNRLAPIIAKKHDDNTANFSVNQKRLEQIIKQCATKNIKVLLVNMPVSKPYLKLLPEEEVAAIIKLSENLETSYKHVSHLNLIGDKRFNLVDFHDADHLNIVGSKKCSKLVNSYLESH